MCCEATSGSSERLTVASVEGASGLSSGVNGVRVKLGVCTGVSCTQDGSKALLEMFNALEEDTPEELSVEACGCFGKVNEIDYNFCPFVLRGTKPLMQFSCPSFLSSVVRARTS